MLTAGLKPFHLALGTLAMMAMRVAAEECPPPATVTQYETLTIYADEGWPVSTVTQTVSPDNCPASLQYPCYVFETTVVSAAIPQATIHMVLPPGQGLEEDSGSDEMNDTDSDDFNAEGEESSQENQGRETAPEEATLAIMPTPTVAAPACVKYVTELTMAPCPAVTLLPTNADGCAILTSTSLALTTATAVPLPGVFQKDDIEEWHYTYISGPDSKQRKKKHHRKHHHKKHPHPTAPPPAPVPAPTPVQQELDTTLIDTTIVETFSTHLSYTLSFDFTYGTAILPPPMPTSLPELPAPSTAIEAPTPTEMPSLVPPAPIPTEADPAEPTDSGPSDAAPRPPLETSVSIAPTATADQPPSDPTGAPIVEPTLPAAAVPLLADLDLVGLGSEDPPTEGGPMTDPVIARDPVIQPEIKEEPGPQLVTTVVEPSSPMSTDPPTSNAPSTSVKKACEACAEPCVVDLQLTAQAEVPLLVKLFKEKIQKALVSLKITLQNEAGQKGEEKNGLFAKLDVDLTTTALFHKTCEDKVEAIQQKHWKSLEQKCEQVVRSECQSGECLQGQVDKAVKLLDIMISAELAKDCSQLRSELVQEFKKNCDEAHGSGAKIEADAQVKAKRGLLDGLLGQDSIVGGVLNKLDTAVVEPLTGHVLIHELVEGLTGPIKVVVDSFVGNCNRKGLLDFDTEKGMGTLAAIENVSVDLFKIVCLNAKVDAKVDTK